jgi:hypothetical protein
MDNGLISTTILSIASSFGVVSLAWNIINLRRSESGFAKLGLECSCESKGNENYVISKTSLENTSRKPIKVVAAFLLIVDQSTSFEKGIDIVMKEINIAAQSASFEKGIDIVMKEINKKRHEILDQVKKSTLATRLITIRQYISTKENLFQVTDKFTIISLTYYFKTLVKLGSFAHNQSTHIQSVTPGKVYSIYFGVFGEDWLMKGNTSQGRVAHDEVLVK